MKIYIYILGTHCFILINAILGARQAQDTSMCLIFPALPGVLYLIMIA